MPEDSPALRPNAQDIAYGRCRSRALDSPGELIADVGQIAENRGFHSTWVPKHVAFPRKGPSSAAGGLPVRTPCIGGAENAARNSHSRRLRVDLGPTRAPPRIWVPSYSPLCAAPLPQSAVPRAQPIDLPHPPRDLVMSRSSVQIGSSAPFLTRHRQQLRGVIDAYWGTCPLFSVELTEPVRCRELAIRDMTMTLPKQREEIWP
jgi:hypothetical protein